MPLKDKEKNLIKYASINPNTDPINILFVLPKLVLSEIKSLQPSEIKKTRLREKVSQAVMAKILNVTPSTYQKWERGEVHPKGANLKLLWLVHNHGIDYILT